jgi:hypothetical protein
LNYIRQNHLAGCGIACIAMISGLTYKQVLKHVYPKRWFFQPVKPFPLGPVLWSLGITYHEYVSKRIWINKITRPSILLVQWTKEDRGFFPFPPYDTHAVVWDPITHQILDPGRKFAQSLDFYQQRACGYYEIIKQGVKT